MLLLDERIKADGAHARTWASAAGAHVQITDDDGLTGMLSLEALDRVMTRYGRALDEEVVVGGESLSIGDGSLRRLRYHARVDAEARDYLVWQRAGREPVACVAAMATAALRYLVHRLAGEQPQETETASGPKRTFRESE